MPSRCSVVSITVFALVLGVSPVFAQGIGEGGCVISGSATVYAESKGDNVVATKKQGECVAGITLRMGGLQREYAFRPVDGRVKVQYFAGEDARGMPRFGWMNPDDLKTFTYDCGCGTSEHDKEDCAPYSGSFVKTFNPCFNKARIEAMGGKGAGAPAVSSPSAAAPRGAEKALRNEDIISLVKVGLDDSMIISKIKSAPATNFDTSTDGLVALKTAKVSNAVVEAMMKRSK